MRRPSVFLLTSFCLLASGCGDGVVSIAHDAGSDGGGAGDAGVDGGADGGLPDGGGVDGGSDGGSPDGGGGGPTRYVDASERLPSTASSTTDALLFDADGDRVADLLFVSQTDAAGNEGGVELLLRRGADLVPSPMPTTGSWTFGAAGDLDRDGDLDVVLTRPARTSAQVALLLNDGAGAFTFDDTSLPLINGEVNGLSFARPVLLDLTGDGAPELFLPLSFSLDFTDDMPSVLLVNDGFGTFVVDPAGRLPAIPDLEDWTICAAAGDVDGDGDLDLFLGEAERQQRLLINAGGTFSDQTLDDGSGAPRLPPDTVRSYHCEFADLDGDGDQDLVIITDASTSSGTAVATENVALWNDGAGHFALEVLPSTAGPRDSRGLFVTDLDGDGHLDILVGNASDTLDHGGQALEILHGQGGGSFLPFAGLPAFGGGVYAVPAADLDGDGWGDVFLAVGEPDPATGSLRNRLLVSAP
ncbi:MAG: VCBS repeat-containing protein [Deltaproteobacteria bacterium]|nr:VCBS repeat-containing protein [Deltaproteobacteria bacterium]